ncbi:MAG: hypothetical protein ACT4QE_04365 [Anaerolineales bacterium]
MNATFLRLSSVGLLLAACTTTPTATPPPTDSSQLLPASAPTVIVPAFAARMAQVQAALQAPIPVLLLDGLTEPQQVAQTLAVTDPRVVQYFGDPSTGAAMRNEVFNVHPFRESDITDTTVACQQAECYRVEIYNYAYNLTTVAVVNVTGRAVLAVNYYSDTQPDLNQPLTDLALAIVKATLDKPGVAASLGIQPEAVNALMASTKTALNDTHCERSRHLCVAPTFVSGERALWAIVDLTDGKLVGVRWTELGQSSGQPVTEQSLQNEVVTRDFCDQSHTLARDGWTLSYGLTSSDGLRIAEVRFNDQPVLASAKLVDWHVSYSQAEGFGYSDAVGCPVFSAAAVVALKGPEIKDIPGGFALTQEFRSEIWPLPCNYSYEQRYEFYTDGRFRVVVASLGRGCGRDGMYRPVIRIQPAAEALTFGEWDGAAWQSWSEERWQSQSAETAYTPEGYQYRFTDAAGSGFYLEPGRGQFGDGGRGDNAYVYVTRYHPNKDEGEADLITIGPCCNTDHQQGPEKFIEPERIEAAPIVIWYVAQLKNDGAPGREYCWADTVLENGVYVPRIWPCAAGPMFVPVR